MFWRGVVLLTAAVLLCGCETVRNGLDYSAMMQKVGPPRPGQSRIVVLREKAYAGIGDPGWDVKLDGGPMSDLKTGTYVYADRSAVSRGEPAGHFHAVRPYLFLPRKDQRKSQSP
jgi:hypothetical protein